MNAEHVECAEAIRYLETTIDFLKNIDIGQRFSLAKGAHTYILLINERGPLKIEDYGQFSVATVPRKHFRQWMLGKNIYCTITDSQLYMHDISMVMNRIESRFMSGAKDAPCKFLVIESNCEDK